jgi:hypothetical protein
MSMPGMYWLATSERERQRALDLARALQQKESRDELGLGAVRDALADLLFPGTSTLHTRARYHFFVPWAYCEAAPRTGSGTTMAGRVRAAEARLIAALRQNGETSGLIGREAGAAVKRMPSTLYWQGLHVWGVRRAGGPQRAVERLLSGKRQIVRDDDGDALDGSGMAVWHPNLPGASDGYPADATFALNYEEADFLSERLRLEPGTYASALPELTRIAADHRTVEQIWEHPARGLLARHTQHAIEQGRRFSLLMNGASWLYNIVLAEQRGSADLATRHRDRFAAWADDAQAAGDDLVVWDLEELWTLTGTRVPFAARTFVRGWRELLRDYGPHALADRPEVRRWVIAREQAMKGRNARSINQKALEQWGGESATRPLDYRWSTARVLIADIRDGLEGGADAQDR